MKVYKKVRDSVRHAVCIGCGRTALDFGDDGRKRYEATGLCQECQDAQQPEIDGMESNLPGGGPTP